jgi:hypothetical protein
MTPEQTFQEFWRALGDRRWDAAASLIHPVEARRRQYHDLALICACFGAADAKERSEHVNGVVSDGTLSPELVEQYRDRPVTTFPGPPTLAELAALRPQDFVARSLGAVATQRGDEPAHDRQRPQVVCLGTIEEQSELAHVVYRMRHPDYPSAPEAVFVATLGRREDGWGLYPGHELAFSFSPPPPWPDDDVEEPASSPAAV